MNKTKVAARRPSYRPLFSAIVCGLLFGAAAATGVPGCNGNSIGGGNLTDDGGASDDSGGGGGGGGGGTDDIGTGGGGGNGDGGQAAYCAGQGPPIVVGDNGGTGARCTGNIAASAFRYGMCLCQGLSSGSPISIDSFDSSQTGGMTMNAGGSMGCNADINVSSTLAVSGTLQVSGSVSNSGALTVGLDALVGGSFTDDQGISVVRNVQAGSDMRCSGQLTIGGTLTQPTGKTLTANNPTITGGQKTAAVSIAQPCDCATPFDTATYVTQRQTSNDNAAIGLDPAQLTNTNTDQTLNLTCGRFYLNRIGGQGMVTLNVSGRTALFIGGDMNLSKPMVVNLGSSGELDIFINGGLTSSAPVSFGSQNTASRVRLYIAGGHDINLGMGGVMGGNVYGPGSGLVSAGSLEIYGALFVRSFNPSAAVKIHHDIAILNASQECGTTGTGGTAPSCQKCSDCGGQACTGGQCGACTGNADCCSPLSCVRGKCVFQVG